VLEDHLQAVGEQPAGGQGPTLVVLPAQSLDRLADPLHRHAVHAAEARRMWTSTRFRNDRRLARVIVSGAALPPPGSL